MQARRRDLLTFLGAAALAPFLPTVARAAAPPRGVVPLERARPMLDVSFRGLDGSELETRDLRGKPSVIVFWATWCAICRGELPKLARLQAAMADRARIAAVSLDEEGLPAVRRYVERNDLDALEAFVDQEGIVAGMMGVRAVPTFYVLNPAGEVVAAGEGRVDWDSPEAEAYLAALA